MSDDPVTLSRLRERQRELELEAVRIKAKVEEVRELIDLLEHRRRKRRSKPITVINLPNRASPNDAA